MATKYLRNVEVYSFKYSSRYNQNALNLAANCLQSICKANCYTACQSGVLQTLQKTPTKLFCSENGVSRKEKCCNRRPFGPLLKTRRPPYSDFSRNPVQRWNMVHEHLLAWRGWRGLREGKILIQWNGVRRGKIPLPLKHAVVWC